MKLLKRCKHCANTGYRISGVSTPTWGGYAVEKCYYCVHGKKVTDEKIMQRLFKAFREDK